MKKILVAHDVYNLLKRDPDFLAWNDIAVFQSASTDEAFAIHAAERVHLIILQQSMPGMSIAEFCSRIRGDASLRAVSIMLICENEVAAIEEGLRCRVNSILLQPVHPLVLITKARQLVDIPPRSPYTGLLSVRIDGQAGEEVFCCRAHNISVAGVLIETDRKLAEGARVRCSFSLADSTDLVHASAKVIRITEKGQGQAEYLYGLMFTELSADVHQTLSEYVRKTSALPSQ